MNDMLPEEQDPQFEELITLLRQADLNPPLIDPTERAQILSRARARLFRTDPQVSMYEDMTVIELSKPGSLLSKPKVLTYNQQHGRRRLHLLNVLAAVLVVAALIGTSFLIFGPWSPLQRDRLDLVGAPVVVRTQAHGLEMTMKITPGPYFLSELLEVEISLTNHTQTTFQGDRCHLFPKLLMIDGEGLRDTNLASAAATTIDSDQSFGMKIFPHDTNLASALATTPTPTIFPQCFPAPIDLVQLQPTKTITVQYYAALTSSGHVTFAARSAFQKTAYGKNGRVTLVPADNPLDGYWPSLQISVSARVPSDRILTLKQQTPQVIVGVPAAVRGKVVYAYNYECGLHSQVSSSGGEFYAPPRNYKISQLTMTLQKPQCSDHYFGSTPSRLVKWTYVVGAPGYAMISGRVN